MTVSKAAVVDAAKASRAVRKEPAEGTAEASPLQLGELSELLGYSLKRSANDRRSHILMLTDKGRAVLARAKKLVASKHEARLNELLGPANRAALLSMLAKIAKEF